MKKLLIALCAVLCLGAAAQAETVYADAAVNHRWHADPACALAGETTEMDADAIPSDGMFPCPACADDPMAYSGIEAWERSGTVVVRIPDKAIMDRMTGKTVSATVPERLLYIEDKQDRDLARLLHGRDYRWVLENSRWREGIAGNMETSCDAYIPDLAPESGMLLMSSRHIGAAWILVVRPSEEQRAAMDETGTLSLPVDFYHARLMITGYPAGMRFIAGPGTRWTGELSLELQPSGGEVDYRDDDADSFNGFSLYVVRVAGVNACVVHVPAFDAESFRRWLRYGGQVTPLKGYDSGRGYAVYCVSLTDGELASLREKVLFDIDFVPEGQEEGDPAADVPATTATLPNGTEAAMDAAAYPVGTPFVSWTLSRPQGGMARYDVDIELERLNDGEWRAIGDLKARADGVEGREHSGWFCDRVTLQLPLESVGALAEGLYRVRVDESYDGEQPLLTWTWLAFRVEDGAPMPQPPVPRAEAAAFDLPAHAVPRLDAETYNSCADATRIYYDSTHWRLLAGGYVYDLLGVDESWGWGVGSHFSLFAYPEGHPEQAKQLAVDIDLADAELCDLGDGLLLESDGRFYCIGYDGKNLRKLPKPTFGTESDDGWRDSLPVGDGVFFARSDGIWYADWNDLKPRRIYSPEREIQNSWGNGFMVYAEGKLLVADGGIVAIDALHPGPDGRMPAARLTESYDPDDGDNGFGYIVLNHRLYGWSAEAQATVSMKLDGSDVREVSKAHFWFYQVAPQGIVLALTGTEDGIFGDQRTAAAFYLPDDPENPAFDPDRCRKIDIEPDCFDYVLGDWLYHVDKAGIETLTPVEELMKR